MFYLLKCFSQVKRTSSKIHGMSTCMFNVCMHTHTHIYACVYTVKPFNGFNSLYFET